MVPRWLANLVIIFVVFMSAFLQAKSAVIDISAGYSTHTHILVKNRLNSQANQIIAQPILSLVGPSISPDTANTFNITITISSAVNLGAFEFDLIYDDSFIEVKAVTLSDFLGKTLQCDYKAMRCAHSLGSLINGNKVKVGAFSYGAGEGASGEGVLAILQLRPRGVAGMTSLQFDAPILTDIAANPTVPVTHELLLKLVPPGALDEMPEPSPNNDGHHIFLPVIVH